MWVEDRISGTTEIVMACWLGSGLLLAMTFEECCSGKFKATFELRVVYL